MATIFGTAGNDTWLVNVPGTYVFDGLAGVDRINWGTSTLADYDIALAADGAVQVDSVSGASQQLHATFYNFEIFLFNTGNVSIDLRTYFNASLPPTAVITDFTNGVATGAVNYDLNFSKPVTGLEPSDFEVSGGSVIALSGSSTGYAVTVQPSAGAEGTIGVTLKAGAVVDSSGNVNAAASAAPQAFDTLAPRVASSTPGAGATAIATSATLTFDFSESVRAGSGTVVLRDAAGTQLGFWSSSDVSALLSGTRLTLTPSKPLPAGATLNVDLGAGLVVDLAGNGLAATRIAFSTSSVQQQTGSAANDSFQIGTGQYAIDGAGGIDQAVLGAARLTFGLAKTSSGFTVASLDGGTSASLVSVERLSFADQKLALDLASNAGVVAKTLGAVFGRESVANATYAGIGLQLLDGGTNYEALMQLALDVRLGAAASHSAVVDLLYTNVVGVVPTAEQRAVYVALLDNRTYTPASLGVLAADTDLNQANIDLVGLTQHGLVYLSA